MEKLEVKGLSHQFRDGEKLRTVLDQIDLIFEPGKLYAILGYSGSGKTTLVSFLSGLDKADKGTIEYDGINIETYGLDKYRRNKSSIVFQQYNLIEFQTAHQNLMTAMGITDNELPPNSSDIAYNLLDFVGIGKTKADRKVKMLSGGEQQRVAIARSLATNVDLVFADEPTGNLDSESEREIIKLFKTLANQYNKCVILVTHSDQVASSADKILRINDGKINYE
ncbi:ABC transporter ATP-binding protein [Mollicutes bacterium LVI A0078]|nr:ABC transporter ATP-binding protein [Mollicutes bacterium LVI A0075]WOO91488.1 ABC transporter ATP-binding protein [Mollicutes bacterium LVI A0078]